MNSTPQSKKYDYIILGAGCAGLSLVMRMVQSEKLSKKKILLIDKEQKTKNDRTWCFWETNPGFFDEVVYKRWDKLDFFGDNYSDTLDISPYEYKMIRGVDFYNYCFERIRKHNTIEVIHADCNRAAYHKDGLTLILDNRHFDLDYHSKLFSSIYWPGLAYGETKKLLQHFKGWIIETTTSSFDPAKATLMDFRVKQDHGTTFAYVLPFSSEKALVELTLFTKNVLPQDEYDKSLKHYIDTFLRINEYSITEEEYGIIPMTNGKLSFERGTGIFYIGTAGGQTKASSGYTFQFIQKQSDRIVEYLENDYSLYAMPETPKRFRFYDNTFLDILYHKKSSGRKIFTELFKNNRAKDVLKFLDNDTTLKEELRIIKSLPKWPFLRAAMKQVF